MRVWKSLLLTGVITCGLTGFALLQPDISHADSSGNIGVKIDGQYVQFNDKTGYPFIDENGRTMVPLRAAVEAYGCRVIWNQADKSIEIYHPYRPEGYGDIKETLYVGSYEFDAPNPGVLDSVPVLKNGRTYLPIRAVFEGFYADVFWDEAKRDVLVYRDPLIYGISSEEAISSFKYVSYDINDLYARGKSYKWDCEYADKVYESYKIMNRKLLNDGYQGFKSYMKSNRSQLALTMVVDFIKDTAKSRGLDDKRTIGLAAAFVQSIEYVADSESTAGQFDEFFKFPFETLYDNQGDCEDTAILLVCILKELGYDSALLIYNGDRNTQGHVAVGVVLPNDDETIPRYLEHRGKKYYYIETTSPGWRIGSMPDDMAGRDAIMVFPD